MMEDTNATTNLSRCLVHQVSPRGGDNYFARVVNGTDKVYTTEGTLSVSISPNGRYILTCNNVFFDSCSIPMQKLAVIHEAGHIVLRHVERLYRMLANVTDPVVRAAILTVFNYAADFAVNDQIVKLEKEFAAVHKARGSDKGEWTFLLPEEFGLPTGKSMDEYVRLMLKDLPKMVERAQELLSGMPGEGDEESDQEGENSGHGTGQGQQSKQGKSSGPKHDEDDPSMPPGLVGAAHNDPMMFEFLQRVFDQLQHENHKGWNDAAKKATPEEAITASNRLKQHARRLVRSAHEQTKRSRGMVPSNIENMVKGLLEPEQVPWNWLFSDAVAGAVSSRMIEEMAMPNTSLLNEEHIEPWPGFALDPSFNVHWLTDTSGSVSDTEYARACNEFNALLSVNKSIKVTYIECDAALQKEEEVTNLQPPDADKSNSVKNRRGYGGTVYTPAFKRMLGIDTPQDWANVNMRPDEPPPRPDLVVVYTDGGVVIEGECFPQYHPGCPIIWLVAPGCHKVAGMADTPPDRVIQMFHIRPEFD